MLFAASLPRHLKHPVAECGPMVFIAHEMSPFSDADVVVFSNCDSVRLSVYDGTESRTLPVVHAQGHMPNAPVISRMYGISGKHASIVISKKTGRK